MDRYIFLDFEFNNAKKIQEVISVGLVMCDTDFNVQLEYHSFVALSMTTTMNKYSTMVNNITDEMLVDARDFKTVFRELKEKLNLKSNDKIFTWGLDDKKTFDKCIQHHDVEDEFKIMSKSMMSIQKRISSHVKIKGHVLNESLALSSIKRICNISGNVTHNALDDSIDLMNIYRKFLNNEFNSEVIEELFMEKLQKMQLKNNLNSLDNRKLMA